METTWNYCCWRKWKRKSINQLNFPYDIYVDDVNQSIYIADTYKDRIVKWKYEAKNGEVVADENGKGNRMDQLDEPRNVIVDKKNNSLIICDQRKQASDSMVSSKQSKSTNHHF